MTRCCPRCQALPDELMAAVSTLYGERDASIAEITQRLRRVLTSEPAPMDGLTPTEWRFLRLLMEQAPALVTQRDLYETGGQAWIDSQAVRVQIYRLRRKVEPLGYRIETVRGFGYRLTQAPQEAAA